MITLEDLIKLGYVKNVTTSIQKKHGNKSYDRNYIKDHSIAREFFNIVFYTKTNKICEGSTQYKNKQALVECLLREIFLSQVYKNSRQTREFFSMIEGSLKDQIKGNYRTDIRLLDKNDPMRLFLEKLFSKFYIDPKVKSMMILEQEILAAGSKMGNPENYNLDRYYRKYLLQIADTMYLAQGNIDNLISMYLDTSKNITIPFDKINKILFNRIVQKNDLKLYDYITKVYKFKPISVIKNDNIINFRSFSLFNSSYEGTYTKGTLLYELSALKNYCDQPWNQYKGTNKTWQQLAKVYKNFNKVMSILKSTDEEIKSSFDDLDELDLD